MFTCMYTCITSRHITMFSYVDLYRYTQVWVGVCVCVCVYAHTHEHMDMDTDMYDAPLAERGGTVVGTLSFRKSYWIATRCGAL